MIVVVFGLPGSGKSFLAEKLSERLQASYVSSDKMRNDIGARGKYSAEDKRWIYQAMADETSRLVDLGQVVVVDATFYQNNMISLFSKLANDRGTSIAFIQMLATEPVIRERLAKPRENSEADFNVYLKVRDQFEEPDVPYLTLQSEHNIDHNLDLAVDYIRSKA